MKKNMHLNIIKKTLNNIKGFVKELKRVRWPDSKESLKMFKNTLIFVIIISIILFLITLAFMNLWSLIGVGL